MQYSRTTHSLILVSEMLDLAERRNSTRLYGMTFLKAFKDPVAQIQDHTLESSTKPSKSRCGTSLLR